MESVWSSFLRSIPFVSLRHLTASTHSPTSPRPRLALKDSTIPMLNAASRRGCWTRPFSRSKIRRISHTTPLTVLRTSSSPPEPPPNGNTPERPPSDETRVSDQEWALRTGRAMFVLQQTLPQFFSLGLVMSSEEDEVKEKSVLEGLGKGVTSTIYSPNIRLSYTPPVVLPPPFPRTLHVDGLPLYHASSAFVRQTLKALYTELHVDIRKFALQSGWSTPKSPLAGARPPSDLTFPSGTPAYDRQKTLNVAFVVSGTARVSGSPTEWDVDSTYTFSPLTGLITSHVVDSIHPAPHTTVYDALRNALGKLRLSLGEGSTAGPASPCPVRIQEQLPHHDEFCQRGAGGARSRDRSS